MANLKYFALIVFQMLMFSTFAQRKAKQATITDFKNKKSYHQETKRFKVGAGPEDFVIDSTSSASVRLIVSCGDFRNSSPKTKGYWSINLSNKNSEPFMFEMVGYDNNKIGPHGIDISYDKEKKKTYLYAISHEQKWSIHKIIIFLVEEKRLVYQKEFSSEIDPNITKPNDLFIHNDGTIYFTNPGGPAVSLLFKKKNGFIGKIDLHDGKAVRILDDLCYPNGISIIDNKMYVATFGEHKLYSFENKNREWDQSSKKNLAKVKGGDNIMLSNNILYVTHHPRTHRTARHVALKLRSPSAIYKYNHHSGIGERLYYSKGKHISGSSNGFVYKNHLYVSQILNNYVLDVSLAPDSD